MREWIVEERRQLADVLEGLSADQWDAPSLCRGWAVRDVVAHITMPFRYSRPRFLFELARSAGRFNKMADNVARRDGAQPTERLIKALRDNAEHPWTPPGGGQTAALTHDVIHGFDITRPLGIERAIPDERMRTVLNTVTGPKSLRFFGINLDGVELRAVDVDWSSGAGAPLTGRAVDLALFLTGRAVAVGALNGDGADHVARSDR